MHCSLQNAVSCVNQRERFTQYELARLKKEEKNIWPVLRFLGLVLFRCFLAPLGVLLVMKTLEDEWYVAIKAYKLSVFEILGDFLYCYILRVRAIPTLESTDPNDK